MLKGIAFHKFIGTLQKIDVVKTKFQMLCANEVSSTL